MIHQETLVFQLPATPCDLLVFSSHTTMHTMTRPSVLQQRTTDDGYWMLDRQITRSQMVIKCLMDRWQVTSSQMVIECSTDNRWWLLNVWRMLDTQTQPNGYQMFDGQMTCSQMVLECSTVDNIWWLVMFDRQVTHSQWLSNVWWTDDTQPNGYQMFNDHRWWSLHVQQLTDKWHVAQWLSNVRQTVTCSQMVIECLGDRHTAKCLLNVWWTDTRPNCYQMFDQQMTHHEQPIVYLMFKEQTRHSQMDNSRWWLLYFQQTDVMHEWDFIMRGNILL